MSWILTRSGLQFDLLNPSADTVSPIDIAHSLSMQCRFNGHTSQFYSVAQHSLLVADLVPVEHQLAALLHDATEAYVGDMVRPLKQVLPAFRQAEHHIWHAICDRFDLDPVLPPCVHDADLIALATERRDLMPDHPGDWECLAGTKPTSTRIERGLSPTEAATLFHNRLMQLLATTHRARPAA